MSEIKTGRLGLYCAEHSKCNHMMTLGFKGLICSVFWKSHRGTRLWDVEARMRDQTVRRCGGQMCDVAADAKFLKTLFLVSVFVANKLLSPNLWFAWIPPTTSELFIINDYLLLSIIVLHCLLEPIHCGYWRAQIHRIYDGFSINKLQNGVICAFFLNGESPKYTFCREFDSQHLLKFLRRWSHCCYWSCT